MAKQWRMPFYSIAVGRGKDNMRAFTMTKRIIKQIIGDKRSLALLFVAPIFVLSLFNIILNSTITNPKLLIDSNSNIPTKLIDELKKQGEVYESNAPLDTLLNQIKNKEYDGLIEIKNDKLITTVEGTEMSVNSAVQKSVATAFGNYIKHMISGNEKLSQMGIKMLNTEVEYVNGSSDMTTFQSIAPMMMGFFIFFFVFLLAGIAFLRERISGTLERLMATPIKRWEIVMGYFLGFGVFVMIQTIIIQFFMVYALGITIKGSSLVVLLINVLLAAGSLSLGTLLSTFAKNEFQLIQFIPIVILPQILFCGIFSLREAPIWVKSLSKVFPLTYAANALTEVVLRGGTLTKVSLDVAILAGYAILFILLNTLALKKYRKL